MADTLEGKPVTHDSDRMQESSNSQRNDRRQFSRVDFEAAVTLTQEGRTVPAQLADISLNGVLVTTPDNYHIRTDLPCALTVILADTAIIQMQVALVHSSSQFLGFHCTSIDMDGAIHLRRLIEINLDDPLASERVLAELLRRHSTVS